MKVKLGKISDSCLGKMLDAEKNKGEYQPYLANINVRWGSFDLENLSQMRFEPHEEDRYGLKKGDLIICEGGEPGRCAVWEEQAPNMKIQKALHRVRVHDCIDTYYLYYWMNLASKMSWLKRHFTETTIKHLPGDKLVEVEIDLPELNIQKNISRTLQLLDKKIQNNERIITELESMAKTIYDYWFLQFDFPNAEGKPYRTYGGKMVWNEQLKREIPKGWNVKTFSDLTTVVTGKEDANFSSESGQYKFFTCSQGALLCEVPAFSGHAVLIAGNGDFNVKHYTGEFNAYQRTYVLIPNDEIYYAVMFIAARDRIQSFKNGSNGSIVKFITKGDVENIPVVVTDNKALYKALNSLILKIELCHKEMDELAKLRDWLLPMLMNGQVTVGQKDKSDQEVTN